MASSPNTLFICTGNVFRSMTAEYALKATLSFDANYTVHSAGLKDGPHELLSFVEDYLNGRGLDISRHQPKKLTREMLDETNLAVAMSTEHRHQINQNFIVAYLFSVRSTMAPRNRSLTSAKWCRIGATMKRRQFPMGGQLWTISLMGCQISLLACIRLYRIDGRPPKKRECLFLAEAVEELLLHPES